MTQYQIAIAGLLAAQAFTLALLWLTKGESDHWRAMWLRDATELLQWKRHATLRDPKTGRYVRQYDVQWHFGAVGDGIADDTAALQKALDASPRKVFIPAGEYKTTAPLIVKGKTNG